MNKRYTRRGFTLIELLVVVLIIGILAAVAVPQYQKAMWKTRIVEAVTALKAVANAEKVYFMENGNYTRDFQALDMAIGTQSNDNYMQYTTNWKIKLRKISGNSIYAQSSALSELYIYYYMDKNTFHCCANPTKEEALQICKGFGETATPCLTDATLSCYAMNL